MSKFYEGMAEIFEIDPASVTADFDLTTADCEWDSLAIVSTIALVDDCFGVMLSGDGLGGCKTISDIEALVAQANKE